MLFLIVPLAYGYMFQRNIWIELSPAEIARYTDICNFMLSCKTACRSICRCSVNIHDQTGILSDLKVHKAALVLTHPIGCLRYKSTGTVYTSGKFRRASIIDKPIRYNRLVLYQAHISHEKTMICYWIDLDN